ncbi:MAG: hypothetical protein H0U61_09470 [Nocardioidaceae bacterium]|nr:hypothetical protein [Nocardioidaceae bacterium]
MARSAFEARAFTIRRGLEALDFAAQAIVLTGGGAREPWVRQLIGDVLGQPLRYVPVRSASAVGAAALAARESASR